MNARGVNIAYRSSSSREVGGRWLHHHLVYIRIVVGWNRDQSEVFNVECLFACRPCHEQMPRLMVVGAEPEGPGSWPSRLWKMFRLCAAQSFTLRASFTQSDRTPRHCVSARILNCQIWGLYLGHGHSQFSKVLYRQYQAFHVWGFHSGEDDCGFLVYKTLKMDTVCSCDMLVSTYKSTRRWNPIDQHRHKTTFLLRYAHNYLFIV